MFVDVFHQIFFFDIFHQFIDLNVSCAHQKGFGRGNISKTPHQKRLRRALVLLGFTRCSIRGRWIEQRALGLGLCLIRLLSILSSENGLGSD
jgi:predicted nucleotidyltransferase